MALNQGWRAVSGEVFELRITVAEDSNVEGYFAIIDTWDGAGNGISEVYDSDELTEGVSWQVEAGLFHEMKIVPYPTEPGSAMMLRIEVAFDSVVDLDGVYSHQLTPPSQRFSLLQLDVVAS